MKLQKIILTSFIALAVAFSGCVQQPAKTASIGTIDGQAVAAEDFTYLMYVYTTALAKQTQDISSLLDADFQGKKGRQIITDNVTAEVVSRTIQLAEAKKANITLTDADKAEIEKNKQTSITNLGGKDSYQKSMTEKGITEKAAFDSITNSKYISKLQASFDEKAQVTDADMQAYFKQNNAQVKHILFMTVDPSNMQALPDDQAKAKQKLAQETLAKIKAGESYDTLMQSLTDDKEGLKQNPNGYNIWKDDTQMDPVFTSTAFSLEAGKVSEIVQISYGYDIIMRVDNSPEWMAKKDEIGKRIKSEQYSKQIDAWKAQHTVSLNNEEITKIANEFLNTKIKKQ